MESTKKSVVCPKCQCVGSHLSICPTQLATREQRIEYGSRIFSSLYPERYRQQCEALGFTENEILVGAARGNAKRRVYENRRAARRGYNTKLTPKEIEDEKADEDRYAAADMALMGVQEEM